MAFGDENINIQYPNFCLAPQDGVFGTVNTSAVDTIVRFKNTGGDIVVDYDLDTDISPSNELLAIEYVGPLGLSAFEDGLTFFTLEKQSTTTCLIKRWETNTIAHLLELKQTITKTTSAGIYYDALGFAVEHYRRNLSFNLPAGQNYFETSSTSRIVPGDIILLGPSTDFDNPGAYENVTVDYVAGNKVYITAVSGTQYDYVDGDDFTFFNNIYVISDKGYLGDARYGNIIKLGAYTGTIKEYNTSGAYKGITGARWYTSSSSIACIDISQLIFVRPYDSYQNWRSLFLNNIENAYGDYFEIYDVIFDTSSNLVYKLAKKTLGKDDTGNKTMYTWTNYNYQTQSLSPYTQSITIYTKKQSIINAGYNYIYIQTRDQYGVGLLDVNIQFYKDGAHTTAQFDPLNGVAVTDSNGETYIKYSFTPPAFPTFEDTPSVISVRADKGSPASTGTEYVWNELIVFSENLSRIELNEAAVRQIFSNDTSDPNDGRLYQINSPFLIKRWPREIAGSSSLTLPDYYLICKSIFGTPMGDWIDGGDYDEDDMPWYRKTPDRTDGPPPFGGAQWDCTTWPNLEIGEAGPCTNSYSPRAHFITQVLEKTQFNVNPKHYTFTEPRPDITDDARPLILPQPKWYLSYKDVVDDQAKLEEGHLLYTILYQFYEFISNLQLSQLKLSRHTHYVDGNPYDELFTNTTLDQFVFVEDADPAFFSYKNPIETDIWIRLRPFAFNLDGITLKFYIREVWSVGDHIYDTGYYDVASYGSITSFDAGGEMSGIEFLYNPSENFHHGGIVYVHIEVYDISAEPNFIYVDYWFRLVADYNTPYLVNLNPDREEDYVSTTTNLYFEIKDDGAGVNIDTLEVYLNSRIIYHSDYAITHPELNLDTTITEINLNYYTVSIDIPYDLYYDKMYTVKVIVDDISPSANTLRDSYRFYTRPSESPIFVNFDPRLCKRGMPRFTDVSFLVLADGNGVDRSTIRLQVHDRDVTNQTTNLPIIYRAVGPEFNPNPLSLQISNITLAEEDYITTASGTLCVDITDYTYNVVTSGTYFIVNNTTSSGIFTTISDGYNMCYGPIVDLAQLAGPTIFTVHAENDNNDSVEVSFYVTSGYIVEFKHKINPYDYDKQVVVRASAENSASCPEVGVDAYWFTTVPKLGKDLGASIVGVPWSESNLGASITPTTDTIYFYGKVFNIELRAKDLAGNVMEPYIFEFRIEDKPE